MQIDTTIFEKSGKLVGICSNNPILKTYKNKFRQDILNSYIFLTIKVLQSMGYPTPKITYIPITVFSDRDNDLIEVINNTDMTFDNNSLSSDWGKLNNCLLSINYDISMNKKPNAEYSSIQLLASSITILKTPNEVERLYPVENKKSTSYDYKNQPTKYSSTTVNNTYSSSSSNEDDDDIPF
jgi:hypothetical protein